ncbi:MAG: hypothetical protein SFU56_09375 [Capsulimonadales bacterium]|nr:hypothetical protein [Capsulimonadales bacterium]
MRAVIRIAAAGALLLCMTAPGWTQIYGPDGEELPPVPETPPDGPTPPSSPRPSPPPSAPPRSRGGSWPTPEEQWLGWRPWRVGLNGGGFFPVGALSDRTSGSPWATFALSYEFRRPSARHPITLTAFAEAAANSRTFFNAFDDRVNEVRELYGAGLEARAYFRPPGPLAFYSGVGFGGYYLRRAVRDDSGSSPFLFFDDRSVTEGRYALRPGYKFLLGIEENHGIFFEMRYLNAGTLEGVRYQGVSAHLGGRF